MSGAVLEAEVLKLSPTEKAHLIDTLWQSLDSKQQIAIDHEWLAESHDRLKAFRAGELKALDGETAIQSIESELNR